jgi:hypothetical protein
LAFAASAQTLKTVNFPAGANGQIVFVVPAHKVMCTYTPKGGTAVYKPFAGYVRVILTPKSVKRFDKVGDRDSLGVDNPLPQGSRWSQGPFVCDSTVDGLACTRSDGRGFVMGRKSVKVK